jgi:hypothetical protein
MTAEDLRHQFHNEEGISWENSQGEPDIDYVIWLERKVLKQAIAERMPTEEQLNIEINYLTKNCFKSKKLRGYTDREIKLGQQAWSNCYKWFRSRMEEKLNDKITCQCPPKLQEWSRERGCYYCTNCGKDI